MDEKTGKMVDILIEDSYSTDKETGMKYLETRWLNVWADAGMSKLIEAIPGITNVFDNSSPTEYMVFIDPRYDREFLKKEIEAAIMCI